jgi:hypothetical protein
MVRGLINNHESLRRRLSALPWNRDVNLAIQVQEQLQDPLKLAELSDNVPSFMKHLSLREIEDSEFEFRSWKPDPIRKTLLPIPEQIQAPSSTLEEAHEAILDAMEEERDEDLNEPEIVEQMVPKVIDLVTEHKTMEEKVNEVEEIREIPKIEENQEPTQPPNSDNKSTMKEKPNLNEQNQSLDKSSFEAYKSLLLTLGLKETAQMLQNSNPDSVKLLRKSLATHVGVEPRDLRIDRMLRVLLRLLPNGDENDVVRSDLVTRINTSLPKYNKWMKSRLEARHSGSKGNFLMDSKNLGNALNRIPGPGFAIPLNKDDKVLPNSQDLGELSQEVEILLRSMNLPSASGIIVEAA